MEHVVGLQFTGKGFYDPAANNGLGEYKAYMVLVKEGHENEAQDKMRAFASAGIKNGVRVRDGVVAMSRKQLQDRIKQLDNRIAQIDARLAEMED